MPFKDISKTIEEHTKSRAGYDLGKDKDAYEFFSSRKGELQEARQNVVGVNLEAVWKAADKAYIPHNLKTGGEKKTLVEDEELGWRSTPVVLGRTDDWQEDSVPVNPYVKIQTALGILIDRNPRAVFKAMNSRYEASNDLQHQLYKRNWDVAQSKEMLKTVVFNAAKYGIIEGMTAPLTIERKVRDIVKDGYKEETIKLYDDVYRWALDPWNTWFDDMAKPGDYFSMNDWMRSKVYGWDSFAEQFGHLDNFKYVVPDQPSRDDDNDRANRKPDIKKATVKLWFYENLAKDTFYIQTDDGVVLVNEPIPKSPKNKRLSCWAAPWTLRHHDTIYGIGVYEAMRNDYKMYLKVRNMTMDQLVLSIYKEWFYEGTQTLQNTGDMKIRPGTGRQVTNAKNITWNEVPPPGADAWKGLEFIGQQIDEATGITKTLEGNLSPKAKAFDIAQAREASLKRLKTPLDNLAFALEQDAYISVGLFEELYSIPEVEKIAEPDKIAEFKNSVLAGEVKGVNMSNITENEDGSIEVERPREFPLNLDRNPEGKLIQTKEEKFFQIRPDELPWEGKISITGQSIVAESPLLEKQNKLELANLLIPLYQQPPELVLPTAKQLLKIYDEEPEDWFPLPWLQLLEAGPEAMMGQPQPQPLFVPRGGQAPGGAPPMSGPGGQARRVVGNAPKSQEQGKVGQFLSKLNPFNS